MAEGDSLGIVIADRYELRRELGVERGAVVYEARHQVTGRRVRIEVVTAAGGAGAADARARLARVASVLGSVRHPCVQDVLDAHVGRGGVAYLALEWLDGRTLEGLLAARGEISVADSVSVVAQVARGLRALRRAEVKITSIETSQVVVADGPDGTERVVLVDVVADDGGDDVAPADEWQAVSTLGKLLAECLTGMAPTPATLGALAERAPGAAPALVALCRRSASARSDDRPPTIDAFLLELEAAGPAAGAASRLLSPGTPPQRRSMPPAAATPAAEERRAPRAHYATPARILPPAGGEITGRTEDISATGLLVVARVTLPVGMVVTLKFALPMEGKIVSCRAEVRWVRDARPGDVAGPRALGLQFVDAPAELATSATRYVELMSRT
jgi:hypothetical protein